MSVPEYIDETHQMIVEFADRFIDDEDERTGFVDSLMERHGYQRESRWAPPLPDDSSSQGGKPPLLRQGQRRGGQGQGSGRQQGSGGQGGQSSYWRRSGK